MRSKHPYAAELEECRKTPTQCVLIRDGGHDGTTIIYRGNEWLAIKHYASNEIEYANEIALATLNTGDLDNEETAQLCDGLTELSLACDLDGRGLWLLDVDELGRLEVIFGDHLKVIWRSDENTGT